MTSVAACLLELVNEIDMEDSQHHVLSEMERVILQTYKDALLDTKRYYVKANLESVKEMLLLVTNGNTYSGPQALYSEILRMNLSLISKRLGNELILKKTFK